MLPEPSILMSTSQTTAPSSSGAKQGFISLEARAVLIESILSFSTAKETQDSLARIGVLRRERAVMNWLQGTRQWLGLPPYYPRANVSSYRQAICRWIRDNGRPSRERVLAGWSPSATRQDVSR